MPRLRASREGITEELRDARDRYVLVLIMITLTVFFSSVIPPLGWGAVFLVVLQSATLMLALTTSDARPRVVWFARWIAIGAIGISVIAESTQNDLASRATYALLMMVIVVAVPLTIIRRLRVQPKIDMSTVMGALSVYLLIGLFYTVAYQTYQGFTGQFFASGPSNSPSDFIYFSYVTLATVGYGDFVAGDAIGRIMAVSEALVGQTYLVTVVALIVANIGRTRYAVREEVHGDRDAEAGVGSPQGH